MSELKATLQNKPGYNDIEMHPDFRFITRFGVINFDGYNSNHFRMDSKSNEVAILILEGSCNIYVDSKKFDNIASRKSVFDGLPAAVYAPIGSEIVISGGPAKIAMCAGKCDKKTEPALITPEKIKVMSVGKDNWSREVRLIVGKENSPCVNIILGETINFPGNWSGTPPHKHEVNDIPKESLHEELYYFQVDKPQGWGMERIYSRERNVNDLIFLENNTVTFMPWGYHQIVSAPGYNLYYTFFLAGEGAGLTGFEDPDHKWVRD